MVRRTALRALAALAATCLAVAGSAAVAAPASASSVCTVGSSPSEAATLGAALGSASSSIGDTHGIAVYDVTTGVSCGLDSGDQMITASIVKVSILAALLVRHQDAGTSLTATEKSEAVLMIEDSDNDAATDLYEDLGKAAGLQAFFKAAGMGSSVAAAAWGLTETTAADQVKLLKALLGTSSLLSSAGRAYELGLMRGVESDQRWGTPYDAASGLTVAVKNGWLYQDDGAWHINSLGVFTGGSHTYVMAVVSQDNSSESGGISEVETLAKAVNTRILGTSTKTVATKTAAAVTRKAVVAAKPSPSAGAAKASPSPSPSASPSASQHVVVEPLATSAAAATSDSRHRITMTLTVLAGVTAPGGLLLVAARRRRLFATGPGLEVEPEAAEPEVVAPESTESGKPEPDNVVPDNPPAA